LADINTEEIEPMSVTHCQAGKEKRQQWFSAESLGTEELLFCLYLSFFKENIFMLFLYTPFIFPLLPWDNGYYLQASILAQLQPILLDQLFLWHQM